jgi:glycosyltransferase involved in cell wall biosynthesis
MSERQSVLRVNALESPAWAQRQPAPALGPVPRLNPRVAIVSDALSGRNGLDSYYRDLAVNLPQHGPLVTLINPDPAGDQRNYRWCVPMPGDTQQRICLPRARDLYRRIRMLAPDVIVVPACGPFGYLGAYAARRLGRPLIAGLHTDLEELARLYWRGLSGWVAKRALEGASRLLFREAHAVVVNADRMAATAKRLGARRTLLMGTSLAPEFSSPAAATLARRLGRIAYAGRLAPEKNIQGLLEAARRLPHLAVEVAGSGPLQSMVEESARHLPNLRYRGLLSREGVADLIDRCDALVLPSRVEAFGTVALEAMARNRVVIASPQCGIARWPELAEGIFVMQPGETVTDALVRIAALPASERSTRAHLGRGAALDLHHKTLAGWTDLILSSLP